MHAVRPITVSIVYFSHGGTTALLAEAIAAGAQAAPGMQVHLLPIQAQDIHQGRWENPAVLEQLSASEVIVFGAPTLMGGAAAQFKAFADATGYIWYQRGWQHKLAAGFTISASPSGDKLHTLSYLNILAAQHSMLWLNWDEMPRQADGTNHLGSFIGLMAQNANDPGTPPSLSGADQTSAFKYGSFIAASAARLLSHLEVTR